MIASDVHSAQSRLKHRKILGMGAGADGNIPRSKISQLLGNEDFNHIVIEDGEFPTGLRCFQWCICILFGAVGLINVLWPQHFYRSATPGLVSPSKLVQQVSHHVKYKMGDGVVSSEWREAQQKDLEQIESYLKELESSMGLLDIPVRLYGTACLSLCALFFIVAIINRDNRRAIRIALAVQATYFFIDILVTCLVINPLTIGNLSWLTDPISLFWFTNYKVIGFFLSLYYFLKTHPSPRMRE